MAGNLVVSLVTLYGVAEGVENTPAGADVVVVVDFHRTLFSTGGYGHLCSAFTGTSQRGAEFIINELPGSGLA